MRVPAAESGRGFGGSGVRRPLGGSSSILAPLRGLADRFSRGADEGAAEEPQQPQAMVVVRGPDGSETRVPVWDTQLSVGASRQCDITLGGEGVRFVHLILTAVSDSTYRVFRFGPVSLLGSGEDVVDDALITAGQWIAVGEHLIRVEGAAALSHAA